MVGKTNQLHVWEPWSMVGRVAFPERVSAVITGPEQEERSL